MGDTCFSRTITVETWEGVFMSTYVHQHTHIYTWEGARTTPRAHTHTGVLATASFNMTGLYPEVRSAEWRSFLSLWVCVCKCVSVNEEGNSYWWGHELVKGKNKAFFCFSITSHSKDCCCAFVVDTNQIVHKCSLQWINTLVPTIFPKRHYKIGEFPLQTLVLWW